MLQQSWNIQSWLAALSISQTADLHRFSCFGELLEKEKIHSECLGENVFTQLHLNNNWKLNNRKLKNSVPGLMSMKAQAFQARDGGGDVFMAHFGSLSSSSASLKHQRLPEYCFLYVSVLYGCSVRVCWWLIPAAHSFFAKQNENLAFHVQKGTCYFDYCQISWLLCNSLSLLNLHWVKL